MAVFTTYGGVLFMIHDAFAGGHPIIAIGTAFGNFAEDRPAAEIIQFPFGYPSQPDLLEHVMIADSGVPLSSESGNANVVMQDGKEAIATVLNGTTAGRVRWSEPISGGPSKQVILNFKAIRTAAAPRRLSAFRTDTPIRQQLMVPALPIPSRLRPQPSICRKA